MRKNLGLVCVLLCLVWLAVGCGTTVKRVDTESVIDLSGRWNDTDSRLVSEEMIADCINRPWVSQFTGAHGKSPVVIVGTVINRSQEHINIQTFTKDLERALINSGQVNFVASSAERQEIRQERLDQATHAATETVKESGQETGADYMLKGTINTISDREGGKSVMFYQVDLELIDLKSNQKVWIGDKKIKKFIKQSRLKP